jgi:hypothetical protein
MLDKNHGVNQMALDSEGKDDVDEARRARRKMIWSKLHVVLAAIGTLSAVVGIAVSINGGLEFNRTKVFVGVGIIVVSTILYVSMLFVDDKP